MNDNLATRRLRLTTMRLCAAILMLSTAIMVGWVYQVIRHFDTIGQHRLDDWRIYLPLPIGAVLIYTVRLWRDSRQA